MSFAIWLLNCAFSCFYALKRFFHPGFYYRGRKLPQFTEVDNAARSAKIKAKADGYDMYVQWDGETPMVVLTSLDLVKQYFKNASSFGSLAQNTFYGYAYEKFYDVMLGATDGKQWLALKQPLTRFYSYSGVQANMHIIDQQSNDWLVHFRERLPRSQTMRIDQLGIAEGARAMLGTLMYGHLSQEDLEMMAEITEKNLACMDTRCDYTARLKFITNNFTTETTQLVDETWNLWCRWNQKKMEEIPMYGNTLFADMASAECYSDERVFFQTMYEMLMLNLDVMGFAIAHTIKNIAQDADLQDRLLDELKTFSAFPISGLTSLDDLPLTRSVICESARLSPPLEYTLPVHLLDDWRFDGGILKRGTKISQDPYIINRNGEIFEEPNTFQADRFVGVEGLKKMGKFHRFGLGPRKCLGNVYADYVIVFAIDRLVRSFKMELIRDPSGPKTVEAFPIVNKAVLTDAIRFLER